MPSSFNPLDHPIIFATPRRLSQDFAWQSHIPFAMLLVELLEPRLIVELGTHYGDSYCAFCQATQELCLPTRCYAVDTWREDSGPGRSGPEVLADLRDHHDRLYGSFSQLVQGPFDEAQARFGNGTIDLLHIDGYHSYEAIRHDFECWFPKLSPRGVVLVHEINTHERDFGTGLFWNEIKTHYPSLEFFHGYGLGVLAVGPEQPQALLDLMSIAGADLIRLRNFFFQLSYSFWHRGQQETLLAQLGSYEDRMQALAGQLAERQQLAQNLTTQLAEKEQQAQNLYTQLEEREQAIQALHAQLADQTQRVRALQQSVDEQTGHLDALTARIRFLTQRDQELRTMLLGAHEQLVQRDELIEQLRNPDAWTPVRQDEVSWLRSQIKEMQATRIWQLGLLYWRFHAWLTQSITPKG